MKVHHFDPNGFYQGSSDAFPDPMREGKFLLPASSSFTAPPVAALPNGQHYKWNGNSWNAAVNPAWQAEQDRIAEEAAKETERVHRVMISERKSKLVIFYDTEIDNRIVDIMLWGATQPDENADQPLYQGKSLDHPDNTGIQYVLKSTPLAQAEDLKTALGGMKYRVDDNGNIVLRNIATVQAETMDAAWTALRTERDVRISATDWLMLPDVPIDEAKRQEFIVYRQALRDLPENTTDPHNPVWPVKPALT